MTSQVHPTIVTTRGRSGGNAAGISIGMGRFAANHMRGRNLSSAAGFLSAEGDPNMFRPRLVHLLGAAALVIGAILLLLAAPRHRRAAIDAGAPSEGFLTQVASLQSGAPAAPPARATVEAASADALEVMVAARRLVRTGSLSVEVDRYAEAAEKAVAIAESHGGYLAGAKATREAGDRQRGDAHACGRGAPPSTPPFGS